MISEHLVDTNLFSFGKHLVDTKPLASVKMLTDLTYLPNRAIYEKFE